MLLVVAVVAVTGSVSSVIAAAAGIRESTGSQALQQSGRGVEVERLRTEFSRTERLADGTYAASLSSEPVNYRDRSGRWRPIDNRLVRAADGVLSNAANSVKVALPANAHDDVVFRTNRNAVAFSLVGADPSVIPTTDGSEARYADALPGVDVTYEAEGKSLKETLTLASAAVPTTYVFKVNAPGLTPTVAASGDVVFKDRAGRERIGFAAPWMQDSSGAVSRAARYEIETAGGSQRVVLRLDKAWITAAERAFPVVVDPTAYSLPPRACEISNSAGPASPRCGFNPDIRVGRDADGVVYRALFALEDLGQAIGGADMQVLDSYFAANLGAANVTQPHDIDLHHLSRDFSEHATWTTLDGRTSWSTPGGDFGLQRESRRSNADRAADGWLGFDMTELAQAMVDGTTSSRNLLVKAADESSTNVETLGDHRVVIRYLPRTGLGSQYTYERWPLADATTLHLNVGNGNLVIESDDLDFDGDDGRFAVGRYLNTLGLIEHGGWRYGATFGRGWRGDSGSVTLERTPRNGNYIMRGPTNLNGVFLRQVDGSFRSPAGTNAELSENADGTLALRYRRTGDSWLFDSRTPEHRLVRMTSRHGYRIDVTYDHLGVRRLEDNRGRFADILIYSDFEVFVVRDQDWIGRTYGHDGYGHLTQYTAVGASAATGYEYNYSTMRLERLRFPDRTALNIAYDGGKPTRLTPIDATGTAQPATTITYARGRTTVRKAGEAKVSYYFDNRLHVDLTQEGDPPALSLTGTIEEKDGTDDSAAGPLTLTASSADDTEGMRRVTVEVNGVATDVAAHACATVCPERLKGTYTFDAASRPDGAYRFQARALDGGGQETASGIITLNIDRTAPAAPSDVDFDGFDAVDPTVGYITWNGGRDRAAPDGTAGSGVVRNQVRYRVDGGTWSSWTTIEEGDEQDDEDAIELSGVRPGSLAEIEARSFDAVGNVSATAATSLTLEEPNGENIVEQPWTGGLEDGPSFTQQSLNADEGDTPCSYSYFSRENGLGLRSVIGPAAAPVLIGDRLVAFCPRTLYLRTGPVRVPLNLDDMQTVICIHKRGGSGNRFRSQVCDRQYGRPDLLGFAPTVINSHDIRLDLLCRAGVGQYRTRGYVWASYKAADNLPPLTYRRRIEGPPRSLECDSAAAFRWVANRTRPYSLGNRYGWKNVQESSIVSTGAALGRDLARTPIRDDREPRPTRTSNGWHAHHMVATGFTTRGAPLVQSYAYRCGLYPNAAVNGVWLRGPGLGPGTPALKVLRPELRRRAYHPVLHTPRYFDTLANRIAPLFADGRCTPPELREVLQEVRADLEVDGFPYRPGMPEEGVEDD